MVSIDELVQYLEDCHRTTCVDGPMEYMHGFGDGFRAAIGSLACYNQTSVEASQLSTQPDSQAT